MHKVIVVGKGFFGEKEYKGSSLGVCNMASAYPEFNGRKNEDVEDFLEKMEAACISNHVDAPAQMLRLLQICLKGSQDMVKNLCGRVARG